MSKDDGIISDFECYGRQMVIVQVNRNVHVMPLEEWERACKSLYPEMGAKFSFKLK